MTNIIQTSVMAYMFNDDGKVLLLRRNKFPNEGFFECPGGRVKYKETLKAALLRELQEETGFRPDGEKFILIDVDEIIDENHSYHAVLIFYAVKIKKAFEVRLTEHREYIWADPLNLPEKTMFGPIKESYEKLFNSNAGSAH